ncbi:hypothetical protein A1O3_03516 [Capronia epimyces CBS 606.96]|uniref:Uncharacterized protein n=1 Tax=Capronia epimyces CBS 606.96 TaxID=1182542 RepID=W9Y244_9EURO|nr:uncharacterized protein A1O3_03516 [Capronia epimyces CBS 606.96]EXJ86563.1 hypothetical protein A1O3_03516 [Capronia epimyces CBS 606.96]
MPFKSAFSAIKSQLKDLHQEGQRLFNEHSQSQPPQQYQPQPQSQSQPPPQSQPYHSYPGPGYVYQQQPPNLYPGQQAQQAHPSYYQGGVHQQQQQQHAPPLVPQGTHPNNAGPAVYWQPRFDPSIPVSVEWEQKVGNEGWGNDEKQYYTNEPANSF